MPLQVGYLCHPKPKLGHPKVSQLHLAWGFRGSGGVSHWMPHHHVSRPQEGLPVCCPLIKVHQPSPTPPNTPMECVSPGSWLVGEAAGGLASVPGHRKQSSSIAGGAGRGSSAQVPTHTTPPRCATHFRWDISAIPSPNWAIQEPASSPWPGDQAGGMG